MPLVGGGTSGQDEWELPGSQRAASSLARSGERKQLEETALVQALSQLLAHWKSRGDWDKIQCTELLFVRGMANKDAALRLGISEQTVANYKFDFLAKLRAAVRQQGLPEDVFPELYEST